jgi:L-lactate dehydrogenase complex protein LldG
VLLSEAEWRVTAVAYLAHHLIVLIDPADFAAPIYACFHTGPSATADIEGVLIHDVQGVRSLSILPVPTGGKSER